MTRVKARHFTASTNNLAQRLSIYIYIYIVRNQLNLIVRGLPREIMQLLPSQIHKAISKVKKCFFSSHPKGCLTTLFSYFLVISKLYLNQVTPTQPYPLSFHSFETKPKQNANIITDLQKNMQRTDLNSLYHFFTRMYKTTRLLQ